VKEITAAFQSEVFKSIATVFVPGSFSLSTLSMALWQRHPAIQKTAEAHPGLATTVAVLVVLTCGLITEDLGARLEQRFDRRLKEQPGYENHYEQWFDYLRIAFEKEPVGHRYLKDLVLRLKFELGMAVASFWSAVFAPCLEMSWCWRALIAGVVLLMALFFAHEAKCSNRTLSDLRRELLLKYGDSRPLRDALVPAGSGE
jgi:hypothetical protein